MGTVWGILHSSLGDESPFPKVNQMVNYELVYSYICAVTLWLSLLLPLQATANCNRRSGLTRNSWSARSSKLRSRSPSHAPCRTSSKNLSTGNLLAFSAPFMEFLMGGPTEKVSLYWVCLLEWTFVQTTTTPQNLYVHQRSLTIPHKHFTTLFLAE